MRDLKVLYEDSSLIDYVHREISKASHVITNTARAEDLIFGRLSRYVKRDRRRLKHTRVLRKLVHQSIHSIKQEYKTESTYTFTELVSENDEGDEVEFEPVDVLADVESEFIAIETASLLAQDDRRKRILESWMIGNTNDSYISRVLANSFGGNVESHRRFITRFRDECRTFLSTAI